MTPKKIRSETVSHDFHHGGKANSMKLPRSFEYANDDVGERVILSDSSIASQGSNRIALSFETIDALHAYKERCRLTVSADDYEILAQFERELREGVDYETASGGEVRPEAEGSLDAARG